MPYDGSGNYSLPAGSTAVTGATIISSVHNNPITDIASALSQVVLRSGVAPMSGNLNANGNKVTGLAAADTNGDAVRFEQAVLTAPSAAQTITSTGLTLESTDAGAGAGPDLSLSRNSASPAANDYGGRLLFLFDDSAGNSDAFAALRAQALDVNSGSEDGLLEIGVVTGGAFAYELGLSGAALYPVTNAGLDLGSGSLRFGATYTNTIELGNASDTTLSRGAAGRIDIEGGAGSLYAASIELGNASDTTLSRASPGVLAVEGKSILGAVNCSFQATKGGSNQTFLSAAATKVTFATEVFDVGSNYDNANSRWTPIAGTVLIQASALYTGLGPSAVPTLTIYKNGAAYRVFNGSHADGSNEPSVSVSLIDEANGTDYYEIYTTGDASYTIYGQTSRTWFCGAMV